MPLDSKKLNHWIKNFYGYGKWDAPLWFIGYEEGGGADYCEVEHKLNAFYERNNPNPRLTDIRELHSKVECEVSGYGNHCELRFSGADKKQPQIQSTWRHLILFVMGYNDPNARLPNKEDLKESIKNYQTHLARKEALIELFPLPNPSIRNWNYQKPSWVSHEPKLTALKSRETYESQVFQDRVDVIRKKLNRNKERVKVVVCYGKRLRKLEIGSKSSFNSLAQGLELTNLKIGRGPIKFKYQRRNKTLFIFTGHPARISNSKLWFNLGKWAATFSAGAKPVRPKAK